MKRIQISDHSYCISDGIWCALHALDNHCILFSTVDNLRTYNVKDLDETLCYKLFELHAPGMQQPQYYIGCDGLLNVATDMHCRSYSPVLSRLVYSSWETTRKEFDNLKFLFNKSNGLQRFEAPAALVRDSVPFMNINYLTILPEQYRGYTDEYFAKYHQLYHASAYREQAEKENIRNFLAGKEPYAKPQKHVTTLDEVLQNYTW